VVHVYTDIFLFSQSTVNKESTIVEINWKLVTGLVIVALNPSADIVIVWSDFGINQYAE